MNENIETDLFSMLTQKIFCLVCVLLSCLD